MLSLFSEFIFERNVCLGQYELCGSYFMPKKFRVGKGNYFFLLKHLTKKIASKSEKVPFFLRYFYLQQQIIG